MSDKPLVEAPRIGEVWTKEQVEAASDGRLVQVIGVSQSYSQTCMITEKHGPWPLILAINISLAMAAEGVATSFRNGWKLCRELHKQPCPGL